MSNDIDLDKLDDDELYGLVEEAQGLLHERAEKLIGQVVLRHGYNGEVRAILVDEIDGKDDYLVVGGTTVNHEQATEPAGMAVWAPVSEVEPTTMERSGA